MIVCRNLGENMLLMIIDMIKVVSIGLYAVVFAQFEGFAWL